MQLHEKYSIPLIAGTDSHEITYEQMEDREYLLKSNHINYPEEDGNYMDFPTYNTLVQRFQKQGERTRRGLYRDGALLRYKALKRRALPVKSQRPKQGSDVFSQSVIAGTTRRRSVSAWRTI